MCFGVEGGFVLVMARWRCRLGVVVVEMPVSCRRDRSYPGHSSNVSVKGQDARIAAVNGRYSPVLHRSSRVVRMYLSIASTFFHRPSAANTCAGMLALDRSVAQPARRP